MTLDKTLQFMLDEIGFNGKKLPINTSAKEWNLFSDEYFLPIESYLIDNDFDFSEKRSTAVYRTIQEAIFNSCSASGHSEHKPISYTVYFGEKGIVVQIKDTGKGFSSDKIESSKKDAANITEPEFLAATHGHNGKHGFGVYGLEKHASNYIFGHDKTGTELLIQFNINKLDQVAIMGGTTYHQ